MKYGELYHGDCLQVMKQIPDGSVDMILCDLPYGTTARNDWDVIIPFDKLWQQYNRIIKGNGAIVLFSQMPFTAKLVNSNSRMFRYQWIWVKTSATGYLNANRMPMKAHQNICVFYKRLPTYNPQKKKGVPYKRLQTSVPTAYNMHERIPTDNIDGMRNPIDVIKVNNAKKDGMHPNQKPVELLEYMIRTYTNEGETVLDNCMGSGSTCVACVNTGRRYIGIQLNDVYFDIAKERIEKSQLNETK